MQLQQLQKQGQLCACLRKRTRWKCHVAPPEACFVAIVAWRHGVPSHLMMTLVCTGAWMGLARTRTALTHRRPHRRNHIRQANNSAVRSEIARLEEQIREERQKGYEER